METRVDHNKNKISYWKLPYYRKLTLHEIKALEINVSVKSKLQHAPPGI